jgi:hypothetical protein
MPSLSLPQARADIITALVEGPRERIAIAAQTQVQAPAGAATVYDPADLIIAWSLDPFGTIAALAMLTGPQLTLQAVAHAALCSEKFGKSWSWELINDRWIALILEA